MIKIPSFLQLACWLACAGLRLSGAEYYAATTGNDNTGTGAIGAPFRTIQKAANVAVAGDSIIIRAGTYRETVRPAFSGTAGARITYQAYESGGAYEDVVISGNNVVTGWVAHDLSGDRKIYKTTAMNWNLSDNRPEFGTIYRNQMFVNGSMMVLARWPNVPAERITRLTYQDLALVSAASEIAGTTTNSAWIENANINSVFPSGYWNPTRSATARVFLSPSTMIWGTSLKIASQASNRLNLDATGTGFNMAAKYYPPTTNNRFFIYDWYEALDTENEYWKDTATNTLYLWAPNGVDPNTLNVEAKRRDFALSLDDRSYLTFRGIKLFACSVTSNGNSNHLEFDELEARYIAHIDNHAVTFNTAANTREFYLMGNGHVVKDSYFFGAAIGMIGASGTNMLIENNVIRDFGYAHNGAAIFARGGPNYGNRTIATKIQFLRNTAFNSGHMMASSDPALDIKFNRFYNSHLRGSDIGAIGNASTDGLGSEIAYNVISDALGPKDNGLLYGGFGIYYDYECRNYTVHHNIVWNTTANSYQLMPIRASNLPGVTDVGMKFYNNTGSKDFGIISPQDIPGVDIRNNLVRNFGNAFGVATSFPATVTFGNNTTFLTDGAAPFRNVAQGDLRYASGASSGINAGVVISPYTDGFVDAAPDAGALEFDQAVFIAGATVTQRQLQSLSAAKISQSGSTVDLQFANLPEGRALPNNFQVQIGSGTFSGTLAYDYTTSNWRILGANKGALTGLQSVTVRLGSSGVPVTLGSQVDVGGGVAGAEIAVLGNNIDLVDGDNSPSGTDHTIFADAQAGSTVGSTQNFTIYNFGSQALSIDAITFTGTHAAEFSVLTPPDATVAVGASTTFILRFRPTATGLRSAVLHIGNNDADESDFDFAIQGQGTPPLPVLSLPTPQLTASLLANTIGNVSLPLQNIGLGNLTWSLASASGTGAYTWADSNSGGPAFNWYDVVALGTQHWNGNYDDDGSVVVNLPFNFSFYGVSYTQITISIDGALTFGAVDFFHPYLNYSLPNNAAPTKFIAAFWDDLVVDGSAQVRSYAVNPNTFVVLYDNVKSYSSNNRVTFQVVVHSTGQITVQYLDNQFTRSYTIGLQNAAHTLGPQVAYSDDTSVIQGLQLPVGTGINRALTFYPPASFVSSLSPASGTVTPGSSGSPSVNLSSSGLAVGTYQTTLTLTSNDTNQASLQIPLTLQVVATLPAPVLTASQSTSGPVSTAFSYQVLASNNPTSYALASGALPPGVTLNTSTGQLSGTPTDVGIYSPAFTATNATGTSPTVVVTITIGMAAPVITASQTATGTLNSAFSYQILANNAPTGFSRTSGTLPPGVMLNPATGLLSGTPSASGTYSPAFTASNAIGTSSAVSVTFTIAVPGALIVYEPFNYSPGANNPDPDGGVNGNNGLPATNLGGAPSGTSTGLRNVWGTTTDVASGITYTQGNKTLLTTGGSGAPNNATWGNTQPLVYQSMTTDPFVAQRLGATTNGSFGVDGSTLYFSLLARTTSATAAAWRLALGSSNNRNVFIENTASGWTLNDNGAGPVVTTSTLALNSPTLIVVRIDFVAGAGDVFRLYVNPTLGSPLGTPNATLTTGGDFSGFSSPKPRPAALDTMAFDEIRLGTTSEVVTPFSIPAPPTGLASFRTANGLATDGSQDTATLAGDGVQNLLKYAFNMIGSGTGQAGSIFIPNNVVLDSNGNAGMPLIGFDSTTGKFQITYMRKKASISPTPGITYSVEISEDLLTWAVDASATEDAVEIDPTLERVTVTNFTTPPPKFFVRVRVIAL